MATHYWTRYFIAPLLLFSLLLITGCGGCSDDSKDGKDKDKDKTANKDEDKPKKPKENFTAGTPVTYPGIFKKKYDPDKELTEAERRRMLVINRTKPGHWVNVHFPLKANNFNANGQFSARGSDANGSPIRLQGTDFYSFSERPVSLPKDEQKNIETTVFLPKRDRNFSSSTVQYELSGATGLPQVSVRHPHSLLHPGQFHFVILSKRPDSYRFVKMMDCVRMPNMNSFASTMSSTSFYDVVIPEVDDPVPFSRNPLTWTTIAYVLWDDFSPEELDAQQQEAMIDWLHFGGQLILSGPDCLDKLGNCFLTPYLPASFKSSANLKDEDFDELNQKWSLRPRVKGKQRQLLRLGSESVLGVDWEVHKDAEEFAGGLVVDRTIGRGRIVMTKFPMNSKSPTYSWQSFSSFFNGCLMRRPSREFFDDGFQGLIFRWQNDRTSPYDPLVASGVRLLSRDLSALPGDADNLANYGAMQSRGGGTSFEYNRRGEDIDSLERLMTDVGSRNQADVWRYGGFKHDMQAGVAGWDDYSGISNAARRALKSAAGIDPPSPGFVLRMLSVYLLILVPVNWLVFRLMGKVEWAWVAAPLIAVGGAFAVVKMASLDIGFVRSQTQLAVLEMHGDHTRGHLTEYSALYTSLSTRYSLLMDNPTAVSLPFATSDPQQGGDSAIRGVRINQTIDNQLEDFLISSNVTGMLHTEMMYDTGGPISLLDDTTVQNNTNFNVSGAGVVRSVNGQEQVAWIGDLGAGETQTLDFRNVDSMHEQWFALPQFSIQKITAMDIWRKNYQNRKAISRYELESMEDVPSFQQVAELVAEFSGSDYEDEPANPTVVTSQIFRRAYEEVHGAVGSRLNLGGMLAAVDHSLALESGGYRLIGYTDARLSNNQLQPKATQLEQMTMVVCHLRRGKRQTPVGDKNHWIDFALESDLDYEFEYDREELNGQGLPNPSGTPNQNPLGPIK